MELLSIPQIANKLKISDNTVRRYMKRFKDCLPSPVKAGIVYKYPETTTELIRKIYAWYEKGLSKTEIVGNLQSADSHTSTTSPPQPDKFDILGGKIDALTAAITGLTTLFTNVTALPATRQTIEAISGMGIKLLSNLTLDPQADTEELPDNINDSTTVSPPRQPNIKTPPQKATIKTPTTSTPKRKIKTDTTTPPTGMAKNGETLKKPLKNDIREPASTITPTGGDTIPPGSVTPDRLTDIEGYKRHVIELIIRLKNKNMTLKEIKVELENRKLKTLTGKESWAIGTIGKLYKKNVFL